MNEVVGRSISEVGQLIARRQVSCLELTQAELARIEETEPFVHAYAQVLADTATEEARHADAELATGLWRGPLHGIPIAFKDLVYTTHAPTEAGSRVLEGWTPPFEATVLRRLRAAGAINLGKTHTHEFAYGVNIPPTRNPWNLSCYPGGSSAGSAVAVAARSAFAAIGTDGGGSIRCPAALNGVVGLKPTTGRVSRRGVVPMSATFDTIGPITRTVEDCALLLQAMAGHDPIDPISSIEPVPDFRSGMGGGVAGMRIGVERDFFYASGTPEVGRAAEAALELLADAGAEVTEVQIPELKFAVAMAMPVIVSDTTAYHHDWIRQRAELYERPTRVLIELGEMIPATHYVRAQRARRLLRDRVRTVFEQFQLEALVAPTLPMPTVRVEQLDLQLTDATGESPGSGMFRYCVPANVTGVPALTIPGGFSSSGLPIGVAFYGRPFQESTLFRIARTYESAHDWFRRSPEIPAGLVRAH